MYVNKWFALWNLSKQNGKVQSGQLPPCEDALWLHAKRANTIKPVSGEGALKDPRMCQIQMAMAGLLTKKILKFLGLVVHLLPTPFLNLFHANAKKSPHHLLVLAWRTTLNALLHVIFLTATTKLLKDTNQTILMNIVRIIPNSCFVLSTCNGLLSFLENFGRCKNVPCDLYKCILLINRTCSCMKLHVCFTGRGWGTEP